MLLENESIIRITFFSSGLFLFWLLGVIFPFRKLTKIDKFRWANNIILTLSNTIIIRVIITTSLVSFASYVSIKGWGIFSLLKITGLTNIILSVIILDGIIYWQHLAFHYVPILWRLHQVHHSDTGFDTTTALRFNPIEIILSIAIKAMAILLIGVNAKAVLVFEVLLNFSAMFNHGNFQLPHSIENLFKKLIVTPDMHRIHHSIIVKETNSNFGFFLSIWDKLFKTYTQHSENDLSIDEIGVENFRDLKSQRIDHLILQPFKRSTHV